jgi:hypothetical protein
VLHDFFPKERSKSKTKPLMIEALSKRMQENDTTNCVPTGRRQAFGHARRGKGAEGKDNCVGGAAVSIRSIYHEPDSRRYGVVGNDLSEEGTGDTL